MHRLLPYLVPILLTLGGTCALPSEIGSPDPPLWMRYPAISPDGRLIAFSFQGHIFLVKSEGGTATPLTTGPQHDTSPVWSPDGKLIAFASDRYGHSDVFVVGSNGGAVRRLTNYSTDAAPSDFTPDGQFVLFSAHRIGAAGSSLFPIRIFPQLYKVAIEGGKKEQLILTTPAVHARFNKAGNQILYEDIKGFEDPWRKHQTSSVTRDIWLYDSDSSGHRRLTNAAYENRNPVWGPDENATYYLSERSGSFNIWRMPFHPQANPEQITFFTKNPVRFLSVSQGGDLCFGYDGEIYLLPSGSKQPPQKVQIRTDLANTDAAPALKHFNDNVTEMALSPSGKEIALVVRGDIYVASIEHGETKRITNTPGQERNVSFSPDGRKLLFAAEYNKPWAIYEASINQPKEKEPYFFNSTVIDIHPLLENSEENFQPRYSPDGKEVAFLENRTTLKVFNLDTKRSRVILPGEYNYSYEDGDQWFDWSPDGKWFLVNFLDRNRFSLEAGLIDSEGKQQLTNLTKSGYEDVKPEWAMGGTSMIWASDRYGLHGDGYSEKSQSDIYEMFFTQQGFDRSKLSLDEYAILKEKQDIEKKNERAPTPEPAAHKPTEALKLDLNNIEDRVKRLTLGSSSIMDAALTPDGETLLYLAKGDKGVELWSVKLRDRELKRLAELPVPPPSPTMPQFGTSVKLDTEGKNAYVLAGG
ncbi:MAG: PD40 domain-containing protein, partial [Verrucomicrobia bacterium]|nr:PD40 domain-containing protein [Verrucomicrobiota bacterium]